MRATYVLHGLVSLATRCCSCLFTRVGMHDQIIRATYILRSLLGRALSIKCVVMMVRLS
jgi:hypothetical protein